jgi:hypothetical protein
VIDVLLAGSPDLDHNLVPDSCEFAMNVHVDANAAPGGDGSSATPFRALRPAVAAALPGDRVLVRDGVYSSSAVANEYARQVVHAALFGGATACVVDLGGAGRARLRQRQRSSKGLTFRNGVAQSPHGARVVAAGGAIYSDGGQLLVRDCVFENNTASNGGALALRSGRIERCRFVGNHALALGAGGAVDCFALVGVPPSLVVIASEFLGNQATWTGGALRLSGLAAVLDGCRFVENSAQFGGAVSSTNASNAACDLDVFNCLFAGNVGTSGGALQFSSTSLTYSTLRTENSTFVGNTASSFGGCQYFSGRGFLRLENCIQLANSSGSGAVNRATPAFGVIEVHVYRNCVQGGATAFQGGVQFYGADNFDLDPLFVSPAGPDGQLATFADNDYRLAVLSPCVDAGDASLLAADLADRDLDGNMLEFLPQDLVGAARRVDDPLTPDTAPGAAPALDLGAFERQP